MSVLAQPRIATANHGRRPSLLGLLWSVLVGGVQAAVVLWVELLALALVPVMPSEGRHSMWLLWRIDGVWALVGAIGWGYLACRLTGTYVASSLHRRGFDRPALGPVALAVAIAGYTGLALGRTFGAQAGCAVVLGAILVRLLAFDAGGRVRRWRWQPARRHEAAIAAAALLVAISYGATHAFSATGGGGTFTTPAAPMRVGETQQMDIGLSQTRLPVSIQSVTVTGPGSANARLRLTVLSLDNTPELATPARLRAMPVAWRRGVVTHNTRLPFAVPSGHYVWVSVLVSLRSCRTATLNTLTLRYTVLGITTTSKLPVSDPATLSCSPSRGRP